MIGAGENEPICLGTDIFMQMQAGPFGPVIHVYKDSEHEVNGQKKAYHRGPFMREQGWKTLISLRGDIDEASNDLLGQGLSLLRTFLTNSEVENAIT